MFSIETQVQIMQTNIRKKADKENFKDNTTTLLLICIVLNQNKSF